MTFPKTSLPEKYRLPDVRNIPVTLVTDGGLNNDRHKITWLATSPTEQLIELERATVKSLNMLVTEKDEQIEKIAQLEHEAGLIAGSSAAQIREGRIPSQAGVHTYQGKDAGLLLEKVSEFQNKGFRQIYAGKTPLRDGHGNVIDTQLRVVFVDESVISLEDIAAQIEASAMTIKNADIAREKEKLASIKSRIESLQKHYLARLSQIESINDRFKAAKK